ncbi:hypothetical protein [Rhodococcus sp. (in: high G+C Gram-positive bacteria)]|uniref:hypothetical protein n=1 Tax=Rhodococcus sp. TaxID=1831 RepID=UPI003B8A6BE7
MMLDSDRASGHIRRSDATSGESNRGFSAALSCGSGATAALPPLLLGSPGIICATLALVIFAAVGLASLLI